MNDKRISYSLLSVLLAFLLSSCAQEETGLRAGGPDDSDILFYVSMPGVSVGSRSYDNIEAGNLVGGFSVSAMNLDSLINEDLSKVAKPTGTYKYEGAYNKIDLYIENAPVERTQGMGDAFRGNGCRWPKAKDGKEGLLQFFAYYPSLETLRANAGLNPNDKNYFNVLHPEGKTRSELRDTGYWFNYRMGNFLINKDISAQADFVGASVRGSKTKNLYSGVELKFEHKLCKVDLKAWGNNPDYDIEVAGVRIGGVILSGTYNLAGNWLTNTGATWGSVEYIFNAGDKDTGREADTVIRIGKGSYDNSTDSVSIMGNGGYAMLIPHRPSNLGAGKPGKWSTSNTGGMYFSVLLRVIDKTDDQGLVLYPYRYGSTISSGITATNSNVVYLTVENATGKITGRVYRNEATGNYFSDEKKTIPFSVKNGEEIRCYGWAAIPYYQEWFINRQYSYNLDYSKGVGVGDPADPNKGKPIITDFSVGVTEDEGKWKMVLDYGEETINLKKDVDYTQE